MLIIESGHRAGDPHSSVINCVAVCHKSSNKNKIRISGRKGSMKFVPDVIPECGGPQHPEAGVDDEHEGEEEDGDVDGDSHGPVLLRQEVQSSKL